MRQRIDFGVGNDAQQRFFPKPQKVFRHHRAIVRAVRIMAQCGDIMIAGDYIIQIGNIIDHQSAVIEAAIYVNLGSDDDLAAWTRLLRLTTDFLDNGFIVRTVDVIGNSDAAQSHPVGPTTDRLYGHLLGMTAVFRMDVKIIVNHQFLIFQGFKDAL